MTWIDWALCAVFLFGVYRFASGIYIERSLENGRIATSLCFQEETILEGWACSVLAVLLMFTISGGAA